MKVRLTAGATAQVRAANAWWRDNRADTKGFLEELEHALALLQAAPDLGAVYAPRAAFGVRRLLLSTSQHYVYYVHIRAQNLIRILAVWSCYRGRAPRMGPLG
ncbi:MAG: type II toxin-antitoxin system RelE/ParE family toxin [Minicystis sp.]